jgi:hypothetical protein
MLGKRGEHPGVAKAHLGRNLERLVRAVRRPGLKPTDVCIPLQRARLEGDACALLPSSVTLGRGANLTARSGCSPR